MAESRGRKEKKWGRGFIQDNHKNEEEEEDEEDEEDEEE